jgi:hypothetical protein
VTCGCTENKNNCLLSQIDKANEMPVCLDMLSSYTLGDNGAKSVVSKTSGYENISAAIMLVVLADGSQLPLRVILNCKTVPKEQLPSGVIVRCQPVCWMINECTKD